MSRGQVKQPLSDGESIFLKVGMLIFLGILLLGLGAERPIWTSAYRAFFVWLVFSLVAGAIAMYWRFLRYRSRQAELEVNLSRAHAEEERLLAERRERRDRMSALADSAEEQSGTTPEVPAEELNETQG
jgi:hypothetical protein